MAVRPNNIGMLYSKDEELSYMHAYCALPTATMEDVNSGNQTKGAIGSPILEEYMPIDGMTAKEIYKILSNLTQNFIAVRKECEELKKENQTLIIEKQNAIIELHDYKIKAFIES